MGILDDYEKQIKIVGTILIPLFLALFFIFYDRYIDSKFKPCKGDCQNIDDTPFEVNLSPNK